MTSYPKIVYRQYICPYDSSIARVSDPELVLKETASSKADDSNHVPNKITNNSPDNIVDNDLRQGRNNYNDDWFEAPKAENADYHLSVTAYRLYKDHQNSGSMPKSATDKNDGNTQKLQYTVDDSSANGTNSTNPQTQKQKPDAMLAHTNDNEGLENGDAVAEFDYARAETGLLSLLQLHPEENADPNVISLEHAKSAAATAKHRDPQRVYALFTAGLSISTPGFPSELVNRLEREKSTFNDSLFSGKQKQIFKQQAPYLIELSPYHYDVDMDSAIDQENYKKRHRNPKFLSHWLLCNGWQNWGLIIVSSAGRQELLSHLQEYPYQPVFGSRFRRIARFQSPEIFPHYISAMTPQEAAYLMKPIDKIILPDVDENGAVALVIERNKNNKEFEPMSGPPVLTQVHLESFKFRQRLLFVKRIAPWIQENYGAPAEKFSENIEGYLLTLCHRAIEMKFDIESAVVDMIVTLYIIDRIEVKDKSPFSRILHNTNLSETECAAYLLEWALIEEEQYNKERQSVRSNEQLRDPYSMRSVIS